MAILYNYYYVLYFLIFAISFSLIIVFLNFLLAFKNTYLEKSTSYECGFNPFNDARSIFDVRFYLVGILFLLFDIEVLFLFPWILSISILDIFSHMVMFAFFFLLLLSFFYEWKRNSLDW